MPRRGGAIHKQTRQPSAPPKFRSKTNNISDYRELVHPLHNDVAWLGVSRFRGRHSLAPTGIQTARLHSTQLKPARPGSPFRLRGLRLERLEAPNDPHQTRARFHRCSRTLFRNGRRDRLSLALQGGGSFGAFTWGVLDRLLEEPGIDFDAISGASAGAVNATLMAAGMVDGGREEARARLQQFWRRMSRSAAPCPRRRRSGGLRTRAPFDVALPVQSVEHQSAARGARGVDRF